MTDTHRPPVEAIKDAYDCLFNSGRSLSKIRDAALGGRLFSTLGDTWGVSGRSIAWKVFLAPDEPLQSPATLGTALKPPLDFLDKARKEYSDLLLEKMRAPDGSYEEGFVLPGSSISPKRTANPPANLETNNPLSLHNENPWNEYFASVELRRTISQDVERTFPEITYFREPAVQAQLTNVLFLYSVTHPVTGYRQGMHELLAPLFYAIDHDSVPDDGTVDNPDIVRVCSRAWVAADAWALFESIMRGLSRWYEWRETPSTSRHSTSPFPTHVQLNVPNGQTEIKPYVAPIVQTCNHIQSTILRNVDPMLWKQLQDAGIEPQIYGIRWLRLLFTREFNLRDAMILWDGLFACDPSFDLVPWICAAMLVRIRNQLIPADYSTQLTFLLRYPSSAAPEPTEADDATHHTLLLLRQALALQMSPTPSTGAALVIENRNLLNIPIEVPDKHQESIRRRPGHDSRIKSVSEGRSAGYTSGGQLAHSRQHSSQQIGYPELIARGLIERGESLGINKTLLGAVAEIRKNLPDLAASLARTPSAATTLYSSFPLTDERPPEERPPWEPRTRFEMERDITELRLLNKKLGESVGRIVDVLLLDESDIANEQRLKAIQNKKREALESLSYVRDILNSNTTEVDDERLLGEEEYTRRKQAVKAKYPSDNRSLEISPPTAPMPVPVTDSLQAPSRMSRSYPVSRSPPSVASINAPTRTPSASDLNPARAPWNYTRSNFGGTTLPTAALPRLPPPTSTSFTRPPLTGPPAAKQSDQSPHPQAVNHDPLGVLG